MAAETHPHTCAVLGVEFAIVDYAATIDLIEAMVDRGDRGYICPVPVHGLMVARRDSEMAAALAGARLVVPDGMPVVWALRLLGEPIRDRVYGPDLMLAHCRRAEREGRRIWLYGGHDQSTHERLVENLGRRFPNLSVAGGWVPPHRDLTAAEEAEVAARINADRPDVVWCGLGSPRQEKWLARMRGRLEAPVLVSVGAAFDFLAGRVRQAPAWMQRRGLEWVWRAGREPLRLLPRYLSANPRFVAAFAWQYARERHGVRPQARGRHGVYGVGSDPKQLGDMGSIDMGSDPNLHFRLESELPASLPLGRGNAILLHGWCFHGEGRILDLSLLAGGGEHPVIAHGMPRADVFRGVYRGLDPEGLSYWSGFWGIVPFEPAQRGEAELRLLATLSGGRRVARTVGRLLLEPGDRPGAANGQSARPRPRIAICMATYDPPIELFRRQIESIRAQGRTDWTCVISDDASRPAVLEAIAEVLGDDDRFVLHRNPVRAGLHRNFERALSLAPAEAELIALADQDDRWHPDKLEALAEALEAGAILAYSDMNVTGPGGELMSPTYWTARPNNHTDLRDLIMTNTVTGAASLFRRSLLEFVLPFPAPAEDSLHDHWIAMVALALGEIAYVDRPLYDYVQHPGATLGHSRAVAGTAAADGRGPSPPRPPDARGRLGSLRARLRGPRVRERLRDRVMRLREDYRVLLRVTMSAQLLRLRCGESMARSKRRSVKRMARLGRSGRGLPWLVWRSVGHRQRASATLGVERLLAGGIAWSALLGAIKRLRLRLPPRRQGLALALRLPLAAEPAVASRLETMIEPLRLEAGAATPARVNLLIPSIDLGHFFGGYIAKMNLARRLAEQGMRVRVVCVDEAFYLPADWRYQVEGFEGLDGLFETVEIEFAHDRGRPLPVSPEDRFVATTWWTAQIAQRASLDLGRERFVYMIQEAEHLTYPMGSWAALARQTYDFPHFALFSTEFLREYFRHHSLGVFAAGAEGGDRDSVAFQNAITPVGPPPVEGMETMERRLLFYARPEDHAQRNMFELGLMALASVEAEGRLDGWEVHGIGAQQPQRIRHDGLALEIQPRQDQAAYAELLRAQSAGLSLMCTPHPSLVPLEMASAGMPVVTNTFENKTRESLAAISQNLIAVEPTIEGIRGGLIEALAAAGNYEGRVSGAAVNWSRGWDTSFDSEVIGAVKRFLEAS